MVGFSMSPFYITGMEKLLHNSIEQIKPCVCLLLFICVKTVEVYGMEKRVNLHQWGQTRNALSWIIELVKNRKNEFQDVRKFLMEEEFTYMEKFDGTNISM